MSQHANHNLNGEEFQRVPYRKRSRKAKNNQVETFSDDFGDDINIDKSSALRRIQSAIEEISTSDVFDSAFASLREGLGILENPEVKEIYCLGLGHLGERLIPRYQLALLICLKEKFDAKIFVHDPIFHPVEKDILTGLGLIVLEENQEGKYTVSNDFTTIFYLPHCPKQLSNNLLWCNWGLTLKNCVIISNSFTNIIEDTHKRDLEENGLYISKIYNYTIELPVINTFKFFDVFNNTAIHIFPLKKLILIPSDFWNNRLEPQYTSKSIEFITKTLDYKFSIRLGQ